MKLVLFGATGGIGRVLLAQAGAAGHEVIAVVRDPRGLAGDPAGHGDPAAEAGRSCAAPAAIAPSSIRIVTADLAAPDPAVLEAAVAGADAVLSALGARSRSDVGIAATATRAIVAAMRATQVRRILVVSAAPIGTVASPGRPQPPRHDPGDGFVTRHVLSPMIKAILRATYADLAAMEDVLRASGLDWTAVRPPRLTDGKLSAYRTAIARNLPGGLSIARAEVADAMLRAIPQRETFGQSLGVAR